MSFLVMSFLVIWCHIDTITRNLDVDLSNLEKSTYIQTIFPETHLYLNGQPASPFTDSKVRTDFVQSTKQHHKNVLLSRLYLNDHSLGFHLQTQTLEPPWKEKWNSTAGKYCSIAFVWMITTWNIIHWLKDYSTTGSVSSKLSSEFFGFHSR